MRTGRQPQRAEEVLIARMRLHIQILHQIRVLLDELPPRLNLIAHQQREDFIRRHCVLWRNLHHRAGLGVHGRLPQLLGAHFAQAFVALNVRLRVAPDFVQQALAFGVIIDVLFILPFVTLYSGGMAAYT